MWKSTKKPRKSSCILLRRFRFSLILRLHLLFLIYDVSVSRPLRHWLEPLPWLLHTKHADAPSSFRQCLEFLSVFRVFSNEIKPLTLFFERFSFHHSIRPSSGQTIISLQQLSLPEVSGRTTIRQSKLVNSFPGKRRRFTFRFSVGAQKFLRLLGCMRLPDFLRPLGNFAVALQRRRCSSFAFLRSFYCPRADFSGRKKRASAEITGRLLSWKKRTG